jgi:hypothetical protein
MIQPATLTEHKAAEDKKITTYFRPVIFSVGDDVDEVDNDDFEVSEDCSLTEAHVDGTGADDYVAVAGVHWYSQGRDLHLHFFGQ